MKEKENSIGPRHQKVYFNRRDFLKATGMAGIMALLPSLHVRKVFAVPPVQKGTGVKLSGAKYPDWIAEARIFGFPVSGVKVDRQRMEMELDRAIAQGANVLEADSRLSDYLTEEDFVMELQLIKDTTKLAHERGLKVVWYYPSLEVITPNGRFRKDTIGRLHPDWLQLSFDRERRGVFYGQKVFWVEPNDESAWMCPNSPYREWYNNRLKQLSKTGVDGLWLDVPLLGLVVAKWGCACNYCREKFARQTGLEFPIKFDVSDKRFWRYLQWRHETLTEFVEECKKAINSVDPNVITIAEVVSLDHLGATEWGTEGSSMKNNFIVWEEDGSSETTAMADASYDDWMAQYNIYKYCRGATMDRPSWAFCYGYNDADSQLVMAGAIAAQNNPYELRVPKMTTSVGMEFRGMMYNWIAKYSKHIFRSQPIAQVAVLYSERNRDFLDALYKGGMVVSASPPMRDRQWLGMKEGTPLTLDYIGDYRGLSIFLFQHQIPADIFPMSRVSEDLIGNYKVLVLPYMAIITEAEKEMLLKAVLNGSTLIVSGPKPGHWDEFGTQRKESLWKDILGDNKDKIVTLTLGQGRICFWQDLVGQKYIKTHDDGISRPLLSWIKDAGVLPWTTGKVPVVIQPYVFQQQMIIHVLNYSWIGKISNQPKRFSLELSVPWDMSQKVEKIIQSEPQWSMPKELTFSKDGNRLVIPLEVGINAIVTISPDIS
ncbi:MAG: twin-arginine translocation signal domain-containing protein [Thermodesulfobacteriota bacterium]|nr:twin-arginine translocation signal domain-containing protein [Thermodesulfobacteriota bacterium]